MPRKRMMMASVVSMVLLAVTAAEAALINYGNFPPGPNHVGFLNVMESSGTDAVPLFGPPAPTPVGLDFDPTSFVASATGGASDITDGQLNFTMAGDLTPPTGAAIQTLSLFEAGDYSLAGAGTSATQALAGVIIRATITAIDGVNIVPIPLVPTNASVGFSLLGGTAIEQPWSLGTSINIQGQLVGLGIPFTLGVTRLEVVIDNNLIAISQPTSVAFIAKKDFVISLGATPGAIVPEPGTAALLGFAFCGLAIRRRK